MPETFRLDVTREDFSPEEKEFLKCSNKPGSSNLWINKPTNYNCGKGI